jgi:hypothetical protein
LTPNASVSFQLGQAPYVVRITIVAATAGLTARRGTDGGPATQSARDNKTRCPKCHVKHEGKWARVAMAAPFLLEACDSADTAFVVINICDGLTPQARGALREAWAKVQAAMLAAQPETILAEAILDPGTAYSKVMAEREKMINALECAQTQLTITAKALKEIDSDAWRDMAHACEFQAGLTVGLNLNRADCGDGCPKNKTVRQ